TVRGVVGPGDADRAGRRLAGRPGPRGRGPAVVDVGARGTRRGRRTGVGVSTGGRGPARRPGLGARRDRPADRDAHGRPGTRPAAVATLNPCPTTTARSCCVATTERSSR